MGRLRFANPNATSVTDGVSGSRVRLSALGASKLVFLPKAESREPKSQAGRSTYQTYPTYQPSPTHQTHQTHQT